MDWLLTTIVVYVIAIALLYILIRVESSDLHEKQRPYADTYPSEDDTCEELVEKLHKTLRYEYSCVKWRSCLIFSIVAAFVVTVLILWRPPLGWELALTILVIYFLCYVLLLYREKHVKEKCIHNANKITPLLRDKVLQNTSWSFTTTF